MTFAIAGGAVMGIAHLNESLLERITRKLRAGWKRLGEILNQPECHAMTITPVNGTILVQQGNREFNKLYEKVFPDTKQGMSDAYTWAAGIALGWDKWQDEEWEARHVA